MGMASLISYSIARGRIFFFQAADGIRDRNVTGVQTCALPISHRPLGRFAAARNGKEFRADFAKIVGKNVVRTFAIVAMKDVDGQGGQAHVRVQASDRERKSVV